MLRSSRAVAPARRLIQSKGEQRLEALKSISFSLSRVGNFPGEVNINGKAALHRGTERLALTCLALLLGLIELAGCNHPSPPAIPALSPSAERRRRRAATDQRLDRRPGRVAAGAGHLWPPAVSNRAAPR